MLITSVLNILSERQFEARTTAAAKPEKPPTPAEKEPALAGSTVDQIRQRQNEEIRLPRPILKTEFPSVIMPSPQGIQELLRIIEEAGRKGRVPALDLFE